LSIYFIVSKSLWLLNKYKGKKKRGERFAKVERKILFARYKMRSRRKCPWEEWKRSHGMSPNVDQGHDGWSSFKCAGAALKTSFVLCPHTTVTDVYLQIRGMVPTQGPFHQTASLLCVCVNLARKFTHFRPLGHRLAKYTPFVF